MISSEASDNNRWEPDGGELISDDDNGSEIFDAIRSGYKVAYEYAHSERDEWRLSDSEPQVTMILTRSDELITFMRINRWSERDRSKWLRLQSSRELVRIDYYLLYRGRVVAEAIEAGARAIESVPVKGGTRGKWFPEMTGHSHPHVIRQLREALRRKNEDSERRSVSSQREPCPIAESPIELN